jgi:hypothetical protein
MLDDADDIHPLFYGAPRGTEFRKLRKRIIRLAREAIDQYGMVYGAEPRAKWLVCLSDGKDGYTLLAVLYELQWPGVLPVDLLACNLDQGQPSFPATVLPEFLKTMQVPHRINIKTPIPSSWTRCLLAAPTPCFYVFFFVHLRAHPPIKYGAAVRNCLALSGPIH